MSPIRSPAYVDLDGGIVMRPPYQASDTLLTAWVADADRDAQQRLLDRTFNTPAGGAVDYRALTSHVLVSFADIGKLSSLDPRDRHYGHAEEIDTVVWMLVGAFENGVLDRLVLHCPYIWVTNTWAMAAGREVQGFPKAEGWAKPPASPADAGPCWLDALALTRYDPTTELARHRVLTIGREGDAGSPLSFGAEEAVAAVAAILDALVELGVEVERALLGTLLGDLFSVKLPMIFLKQFRDASTPDRAAYQAIVEASVAVNGFRGAGLLPPCWEMSLTSHASLRVAETLGMRATQTLDVGFWFDFDFALELGREVWRAP